MLRDRKRATLRQLVGWEINRRFQAPKSASMRRVSQSVLRTSTCGSPALAWPSKFSASFEYLKAGELPTMPAKFVLIIQGWKSNHEENCSGRLIGWTNRSARALHTYESA